jgi:hypothetical protein
MERAKVKENELKKTYIKLDGEILNVSLLAAWLTLQP